MYKIGDVVKLKKDLNASYPAQQMMILDISEDKYLLGKASDSGGVWLTKDYFD